ncbi:hypothetical protein C8F01DRAFT_1354371 [Mycena amicta]|nr:hypothetical protein C8F01DRAFT_1354371 [Mycena amicta]
MGTKPETLMEITRSSTVKRQGDIEFATPFSSDSSMSQRMKKRILLEDTPPQKADDIPKFSASSSSFAPVLMQVVKSGTCHPKRFHRVIVAPEQPRVLKVLDDDANCERGYRSELIRRLSNMSAWKTKLSSTNDNHVQEKFGAHFLLLAWRAPQKAGGGKSVQLDCVWRHVMFEGGAELFVEISANRCGRPEIIRIRGSVWVLGVGPSPTRSRKPSVRASAGALEVTKKRVSTGIEGSCVPRERQPQAVAPTNNDDETTVLPMEVDEGD